MALYDNKLWLLSHIRNSFIFTDDTGMSELVMISEDLPKHLADKLDVYRDLDEESEDDEDDIREPYDFQSDLDLEIHRLRCNTAARKEKSDPSKRAAKVNIKWELSSVPLSSEDVDVIFNKKNLQQKNENKKSLLTERLRSEPEVPRNPYTEYARFDGSNYISISTRKYKVFLSMLIPDQKNYPISVTCLASASIEQLIGFILLKSSTIHGHYPWKPVPYYALYICEEDGEVDYDFPPLDINENVCKFGFNALALVEYDEPPQKSVSFENSHSHNEEDSSHHPGLLKADEANMQLMKVHTTAMEAPLYQSYIVFIINKVKAKAEVLLGISGDKLEIDPLQPKNSKISFVRQKPVSHQMDSIAWCEITDAKSSCTTFRIIYNPKYCDAMEAAQSSKVKSIGFKQYYFEAFHSIAQEIVQKVNLILELRSSCSRKEYLAEHEKGQLKKKSSIRLHK